MLWSWLGVAVTIASAIFISPYTIRKLGGEGYGVWVLTFGLVENFWLFDFGLRSATVKYSAHYRTTGELDKINELLSTGVMYFSIIAAALLGTTVYLSRHIEQLFRVSPAFRDAFAFLVIVVGANWSLGLVFNSLNACLEGFQRFEISSRIWITVTALRASGIAFLLWRGYGLKALGVYAVAVQMFGYVLSYIGLCKVFRAHRISPLRATWRMFRQMAGYGIHTFTGGVATQFLNQGAPLMIGHMLSATLVGYFNVPVKLLQYTGDAVDRVGLVTSSHSAELTAQGDRGNIARLGICVNRYCLTLFMPVAIFMLIYAHELVRVWIRKPDFVQISSPLIPILLIGFTFGIAGQVNSSSILYGMAKHRFYARGLLAEGIALVASLYFVLPRYGIFGAACMVSALMLLDRGIFTPWLLCQYLELDYARYLRSIFARPLIIAAPLAALAFWLKRTVLPGANLPQVLAAATLIGGIYYSIAFFACLEREHRVLIWARINPRSQKLAVAEAEP